MYAVCFGSLSFQKYESKLPISQHCYACCNGICTLFGIHIIVYKGHFTNSVKRLALLNLYRTIIMFLSWFQVFNLEIYILQSHSFDLRLRNILQFRSLCTLCSLFRHIVFLPSEPKISKTCFHRNFFSPKLCRQIFSPYLSH